VVLVEFIFARLDVDDDVLAVVPRLKKVAQALLIKPRAALDDIACRRM
jgi:hypothetical protein